MFKWLSNLYWKIDFGISAIVKATLEKLCINVGSYSNIKFVGNQINANSENKNCECNSLIKNSEINTESTCKIENITGIDMPHETLHNDTFYNPMYSSYECNLFHDLNKY